MARRPFSTAAAGHAYSIPHIPLSFPAGMGLAHSAAGQVRCFPARPSAWWWPTWSGAELGMTMPSIISSGCVRSARGPTRPRPVIWNCFSRFTVYFGFPQRQSLSPKTDKAPHMPAAVAVKIRSRRQISVQRLGHFLWKTSGSRPSGRSCHRIACLGLLHASAIKLLPTKSSSGPPLKLDEAVSLAPSPCRWDQVTWSLPCPWNCTQIWASKSNRRALFTVSDACGINTPTALTKIWFGHAS